MANTDRAVVRAAIHKRIRRKVRGSTERPRLAIYRSLSHIYAQIIDDFRGQTLVSAATTEKELRQVVFDRGGYLYHGRVKALTDAAREAGLNRQEATEKVEESSDGNGEQ